MISVDRNTKDRLYCAVVIHNDKSLDVDRQLELDRQTDR